MFHRTIEAFIVSLISHANTIFRFYRGFKTVHISFKDNIFQFFS